ncbi:hypothetical protein MPTK1_3g06720 [Marchantia polymorpha subsp. ruderalis]|uniref:Uncharacterized protein n=2 Tax=Marchantia polymorpha TaxID=3197 RepID=A0AAF6AY38_MARPO|nr:hypothetical protein MARPO_0006s0140 [Marchantia polymorpha]BBN04672.1 hypothetical protein Mp_3g06720 [Marchantia polymorpha subsp. ruderalis]|eukprot:PTQ48110.1 hypothetical protein MARPO_0006s0140 [Marchantia polymorpha]
MCTFIRRSRVEVRKRTDCSTRILRRDQSVLMVYVLLAAGTRVFGDRPHALPRRAEQICRIWEEDQEEDPSGPRELLEPEDSDRLSELA